MRALTTSAILLGLALGTPAFAQGTPQRAPSQPAPQAQQSAPQIKSVQIVDIKDLPQDVRSQVDELASKTSEQDMQSLRKSIDASPGVTSALKAKGLSSAQVVAMNVDKDGVLTLFAKKATYPQPHRIAVCPAAAAAPLRPVAFVRGDSASGLGLAESNVSDVQPKEGIPS
jgi:hypothetical protein